MADCAACAPAGSFMLETDSPWLAPVPHRGKRNQPAFVSDTAIRIATARGITVDALGALTDQTVDRFFRRPPK